MTINLKTSPAWASVLLGATMLTGGPAHAGGYAVAQEEVLTSPGAAVPAPTPGGRAEHDWHPFSSNSARIYMADVQTIVVEGDVSRVQVAKPPLQGEPGDYSHAVEVVEFRCGAKESRSTTEIQYGADGAETERYEDATTWEPYQPNSRDGFLAALVCNTERSLNNVPSIKAWVDAGRKVN